MSIQKILTRIRSPPIVWRAARACARISRHNVAAHELKTPLTLIEVTLADTGIGISHEDQSVIFEKLACTCAGTSEQLGDASLHSSSKTKFKGGGPGLGLPITRGIMVADCATIIEAHGGTIWVQSEGHDEKCCPGTTFHILLPIRTEPPDPKLAKLLGLEVNRKEET